MTPLNSWNVSVDSIDSRSVTLLIGYQSYLYVQHIFLGHHLPRGSFHNCPTITRTLYVDTADPHSTLMSPPKTNKKTLSTPHKPFTKCTTHSAACFPLVRAENFLYYIYHDCGTDPHARQHLNPQAFQLTW